MEPIRVLEMFMGFAVEGPLGGAERFGIELCHALDKTEIQPIACGLWDFGTPFEKQWLESLQAANIPAFTTAKWQESSPYQAFQQALKGLKTALAGQTVDIIHSHTQFTDVAALLLKRTLKAKALIRTVHNEREWPKRWLRQLILTNWLYPIMFEVEVGVSKQVVTNLNHRPGARLMGKTALCIHNSINLRRFEKLQVDKTAKKHELGLPAQAMVIGSVGRLTPQKGYAIFIESAQKVLAHLPQAIFIIVGGGELQPALTAQIQALGLEDKIILTGPQKNIESLIAIMDVFVSSSLWEGLPTVILESFALGVPVVATNVSGSRELITSAYNGLLVPPTDAIKLAESIIKVLTEKEFACQLSQHAKKVLLDFTIPQIASQYLELYKKLAQNRLIPLKDY